MAVWRAAPICQVLLRVWLDDGDCSSTRSLQARNRIKPTSRPASIWGIWARPREGEIIGGRYDAQKFTYGRRTMNDIIAEHSGNILRIQLNRPDKKNAMTSSMYITMAEFLEDAAKDDQIRVALWHAAGDSFCAGNDLEDFMKNPPAPGESPQSRLIYALINFEKPLVAAVQGAAIGGGTTMLAHCDFVYAGESAKFQLPFVNLALVPEFGSSCLLPLSFGYVRAAELILLGQSFGALRAAELGLVTSVVPDQKLLATATETAQTLAEKPAGAVQACKRLMKAAFRDQLEQAVKLENQVFADRVRSEEAKAAFRAFFAKRKPEYHPQ